MVRSRRRAGGVLALIGSLLGAATLHAASVDQKEIFGWAEQVLIGESRLELDAKLDTGADTSSIHATSIRRFRTQDRKLWVEFRVTENDGDRTIRFKKRLVRYAYIKEHEGPSQKRPVVNIEICVGTHQKEIEVSLVDRSGFDFPVLLGRNALDGHVVVDPELEYTRRPACFEDESE